VAASHGASWAAGYVSDTRCDAMDARARRCSERERARQHGGVAASKMLDRWMGRSLLDGEQRDGRGLRLCLS
jgi:hypothetical protein